MSHALLLYWKDILGIGNIFTYHSSSNPSHNITLICYYIMSKMPLCLAIWKCQYLSNSHPQKQQFKMIRSMNESNSSFCFNFLFNLPAYYMAAVFIFFKYNLLPVIILPERSHRCTGFYWYCKNCLNVEQNSL